MAQTRIPLNCLFCGTEFYITKSQVGVRKFCKHAHAMAYMYGNHLPLGERFAAQIEHAAGCWLWTGRQSGKQPDRYGAFRMVVGDDKSVIHAHRFSYLIHNGPIPDGLWVLHRCDTPLCVNPDHLFLGTQQDNIADMLMKGRDYRGERKGIKQRRVSDNEVREIRKRYAAGESPRVIATDMRVGYGNIFSIVKWKTHRGTLDLK